VGRVRSGCARPLRQPARCQRLPGSAFAGFFPPRPSCCFRRLGYRNPRAMRDGEGFLTDESLEKWSDGRGARRAPQSVAILPHMPPSPLPVPGTTVGRSVPRREGVDKVTGGARYTDDIAVPGAWYGRTIRSTIARGAIRSLTLDPSFDWSRIVVVTADDIPGENVVQLIRDDQPVLAPNGGEIRHKEEPILLLAAPDRATLEEAASHIHIEYELATPVSDIGSATEVFSTVDITKGDVASAQREADLVVEREFRVGLQEQLYIE